MRDVHSLRIFITHSQSDLSLPSLAASSGICIGRNDLVGKTVNDLISDMAKNKYNSKKWLLIFGGTMLALTAITLVVGLTLGRKGKIEKQAEEESKKNV